MQSFDEETLNSEPFIRRLNRGDEQAFEAVFRAYYGRVYAVAYRLLGCTQEADSISQETFLRLYRQRLPSGREHNLLAWLLRVATNLCYNALRAGRRRQAREERVQRLEGDTYLPPEMALSLERTERVRQVLARLPERQAQILLLRHAGLSYAEVAEAMAVATGSVGTLLARAEKAFQELYEQLEEQEKNGQQVGMS